MTVLFYNKTYITIVLFVVYYWVHRHTLEFLTYQCNREHSLHLSDQNNAIPNGKFMYSIDARLIWCNCPRA